MEMYVNIIWYYMNGNWNVIDWYMIWFNFDLDMFLIWL